MIKVFTFRKIAVATLLLLLAVILYNYPEEINVDVVKKEDSCNKINVYLIDQNKYAVMSGVNSGDGIDIQINTIFKSLLYGNDELYGILPKDTKLLSYSLDGDLLKLNFNNKLLNINEDDEELMIESLIFSFTSLEGVNKIMIFVDGERLMFLPSGKKKLDLYLDRSYGINKVVDISEIVGTKMVTVYYPSKKDNYIPISYVVNDNEDKINIIVKFLKINKFSNSNLSSHLDYQVELMNYEEIENEVFLNFNDVLLHSVYDGKLKEEVKYALSYSIIDTLDVENVVFSVNSNKIDEFGLAK